VLYDSAAFVARAGTLDELASGIAQQALGRAGCNGGQISATST